MRVMITLLFLAGTSALATENVDVYVYNASPRPVMMPDGHAIESGQMDIFKDIRAHENWNDVFVTGLILSEQGEEVQPCQVAFRTYKDLDFYGHHMKAVIFVRQHKKTLKCDPMAVEFDRTGEVRPTGMRLSLDQAYYKIHRKGEVRPGKPHFVYEFRAPNLPYVYIKPQKEHLNIPSKNKRLYVDRQESIID